MKRLSTALLIAVVLTAAAFESPARSRTVRVSRAWPVMGTMLTITGWGDDSVTLLQAIHAARDSVRLVDSLMSNYRPESEISAINANAGGSPISVSPQTLKVLFNARRLWEISNGLFDPTVAPLVKAWGFFSDSGHIPSRAVIDSLRRLVGYDKVHIDSVHRTVKLSEKGMSLDLGGIAKGYALDLARRAFSANEFTGGMIDLGGNILTFGRPPLGKQWIIGIRDPRGDGKIIGKVAIDSGAIATSGDYEHFFIINGVRYAHIIDPRTGFPRRGVIAATAVGPRGELSDGVSATLLLTGPARGKAIAESLGVAGVWVIERSGSKRSSDIILSRSAARIFTASREMREK